jgi:hypothetical protein
MMEDDTIWWSLKPVCVMESGLASDVPGPAWAQASGLGRAFGGSGLQKVKPDPKLRAGPGLGLVGLEPGLRGINWINFD